MPTGPGRLPPLIAVVGSDGSGKSTVCTELLNWIKAYGPAVAAHLGKQQGNTGRWLSSLPLVGAGLGGLISRKAATVNSSRSRNKAPDVLPALVMYAFTLKRVRRYRRMLAQRKRGMIVIADRYPQLDIPSAFDGPDMSVAAEGHPFVQRLARREQKAFEWMTSYQPDLIVRLNVDLDTACARKHDHKREALARKIGIAPQLTFSGAEIAEIDANQDLPEVLADVYAAVSQKMTELGYQPPPPPAEL